MSTRGGRSSASSSAREREGEGGVCVRVRGNAACVTGGRLSETLIHHKRAIIRQLLAHTQCLNVSDTPSHKSFLGYLYHTQHCEAETCGRAAS